MLTAQARSLAQATAKNFLPRKFLKRAHPASDFETGTPEPAQHDAHPGLSPFARVGAKAPTGISPFPPSAREEAEPGGAEACGKQRREQDRELRRIHERP